jgi:hypothetical protein
VPSFQGEKRNLAQSPSVWERKTAKTHPTIQSFFRCNEVGYGVRLPAIAHCFDVKNIFFLNVSEDLADFVCA